MGLYIIISAGVILFLIGFAVLERRDPGAADKIASAGDSAWKRGLQRIKDAIARK